MIFLHSIHPSAGSFFDHSYDLSGYCIAIGVLTADRLFSSVGVGLTCLIACIWAGVFD